MPFYHFRPTTTTTTPCRREGWPCASPAAASGVTSGAGCERLRDFPSCSCPDGLDLLSFSLPSFLFPFRFPRPPSLLPHSLFVGRRPSPSVFRELRVMKSGPPVPRGRPGSPRSPGQAASPRRSSVTLRTGLSCQPGKTALSQARGLGWTAPRRTPSHTIGTPTYSFKAHPSLLKTVNSFNSSFLKILETCFSMTADIQYSIRVRCTAEAVRP